MWMPRKLLPVLAGVLIGALATYGYVQVQQPQPKTEAPFDAVAEAQEPQQVPETRPEQKKSAHDKSDIFNPERSPLISPAFEDQPDQGTVKGFDFSVDPLNAKKKGETFEELMKRDVQNKAKVMAAQMKLLKSRYNLTPKLDKVVKMSRGKPICVGPTALLKEGLTWDELAKMTPAEIKKKKLFPYPNLPHPLQATGGQVFPKIQIAMFPRLLRFDVDHDLPEEFLPEFPPAIFLRMRPELGDVSRGEVVSINNYFKLFKDILTPVQLDGLRMLLTPFPQEEFNPTDDRKSPKPSLGVACFDCHLNGHTTAQFHLSPDSRPQERRFRLDTPSLRGVAFAQLFGSMRSLKSVEDFTEFEFLTAYYNGDPIRAMKKGFTIIPRVQVAHMGQMQDMFDFPPAPKLDVMGMLIHAKASESEIRGEKLFFGKAKCSVCHPAPYYIDNQMRDLHLERFLDEPPDGQIKTFSLRGIKESPPYFHDGRCLTLEDTVELFNLVLELNLTQSEKHDLVAFMRVL